MSAKYNLGIADYAIILTSFIVSSLIGVGFRFSGDRQKTTSEYLLGGRNSHMLPVVLSTTVTTMSGIAILGNPAELYKYGVTCLIFELGTGIGMVFASYFIIPVYFRCGVSSIYEYLEMRFGKYTRYTVSAMFLIEMILYMSIVLLAPVLALSAVTDISMGTAIVLCGSVCTFYCFLGGLKAVMWADVFQSILMFICVIVIISVGIFEFGGVGEIIRRADTTKRLDIDFAFDLTTRYTFWNCLMEGLQIGIGYYGTNQIQVQRVLSMSGPKRAQKAILWSVFPVVGIYMMISSIGIVLYAIFYLCDPMQDKEAGISSYDQLVPYFIITRLGSVPGVMGLCIAGVFSGSLSTMSSGLNSMSTVAVVDFIKPKFGTKITDKTLVVVAKGLALLFGIAVILLTFVISGANSIAQLTAVFMVAIEGPVIAIFLTGIFTRKVSDKNAVLGLIISVVVIYWLSFGSMISDYTTPIYPLDTSGCSWTNSSNFSNFTMQTSQDTN
ncbi:hypothetical protein JTE90_025691, partial [Oedothorax gibbosus]